MGPTIERLTARLGRSPTIAEIADGVPDHPGAGARGDGGRLRVRAGVAVASARDAEGDLDPMETIGSEDAEFARTDDRASLEPALAALPAREREILRMRFEDGLTQTQIAEQIGISRCTCRA